jgi:hypothetical protein
MDDLIAITVLTGLREASKTALLNRLLEQPALADTAMLVNRFGPPCLSRAGAAAGVAARGRSALASDVRHERSRSIRDQARRRHFRSNSRIQAHRVTAPIGQNARSRFSRFKLEQLK